FKSSRNEIFSTYHTSSSSFSCQLMEFLPFTCAQPVIPGLTRCRFFCLSLYNGKYSGRSGRGPIKDISPFNTLKNCGNSSIESFLINFPNDVNLSSSGKKLPFASLLSFIVLNLISLNIFSFLPGRP